MTDGVEELVIDYGRPLVESFGLWREILGGTIVEGLDKPFGNEAVPMVMTNAAQGGEGRRTTAASPCQKAEGRARSR